MNIRRDLEEGMEFLQEQDLIHHNEVLAVNNIPPEQPNPAFAWLVWSAIDVQPVCEPPSYGAALLSRRTNVADVFRFMEGIEQRPEKVQLWNTAGHRAYTLERTGLEIARLVVAPHLRVYKT